MRLITSESKISDNQIVTFQQPRRTDIASRFRQMDIRKEMKENCELLQYSKIGKATTHIFPEFRDAINVNLVGIKDKKNPVTFEKVTDPIKKLTTNPKEQQKALTAERLKRFGEDKDVLVTDHDIQAHFFNRLNLQD